MTDMEGDGLGVTNIVLDVADKSVQPSQVGFLIYLNFMLLTSILLLLLQ